ncbi:LysR family transcriptional regulator [uncultured Traorella sp.]|uniref:LysR family transcriptional regulator n=1 Tax=uncultured Traorella sp. TaxID=1929048 RepID=UPI0025E6AE71|nr:LysR family transcriptional regulator [uncultured Traorella sp.]
MNTFQLLCFLTVAETLNFARAAEQLHVTQPAVTQQIHSLERSLNVKLFKRTTRSVKLTEEGRIFIHDAKQIVALTQRAMKRFENPNDEQLQFLSIGCHSYIYLFLLPPVLKRLIERHPALHPRLHVVPFAHLYRFLEEDDVDLIIGFKESSAKKINANYREIAKIPLVCVMPLGHPLSGKKTVTIEDMRKEKIILLDPAKAQDDIVRLQGKLMDGRPFSDFYFCETAEAVFSLVQAGIGIAITPKLVSPDMALTYVPVSGNNDLSFGIYYKSVQSNVLIKDFMTLMKECTVF